MQLTFLLVKHIILIRKEEINVKKVEYSSDLLFYRLGSDNYRENILIALGKCPSQAQHYLARRSASWSVICPRVLHVPRISLRSLPAHSSPALPASSRICLMACSPASPEAQGQSVQHKRHSVTCMRKLRIPSCHMNCIRFSHENTFTKIGDIHQKTTIHIQLYNCISLALISKEVYLIRSFNTQMEQASMKFYFKDTYKGKQTSYISKGDCN